jgi:hypothetical protein
MSENDEIRLKVAKSLTRWMNGKLCDPLPDWVSLPKEVQDACLHQADEAVNHPTLKS